MSNLNKTLGLDQIGLNNVSKIHRNLNVDNLIDEILKNKEGVISSTGAPIVDTGKFTGRSPKDKYIVDEPSSNSQIWWGQVNQKIDENIDQNFKAFTFLELILSYSEQLPLRNFVCTSHQSKGRKYKISYSS